MRLYIAVAARSFQRILTYRAAAVSGTLTNIVFGCIRAYVFVALYRSGAAAQVGGYDLRDALTFTWLTQGLISVMAIWGWWEIADTIRSGAVLTDLSRPYDYFTFWFARDLGRASCQMLLRGVPMIVFGAVLFGARLPDSAGQWAMFAVSLALGIAISFALRFIVNLGAFWLLDIRGVGGIWNLLVTLMSGFELPLVYFPPWLRAIADALPFHAMIQTPADLFLGKYSGAALWGVVGQQALWVVGLVAAAQMLTRAATRKVVVQGG